MATKATITVITRGMLRGLLTATVLTIALIVASCAQPAQNPQIPNAQQPASDSPTDLCIHQCAIASVNMANGPCLGTVKQDWVCDIAHNPRQPVDDLPQNQCADFLNGKAHHFIELDENCSVIRVQ